MRTKRPKSGPCTVDPAFAPVVEAFRGDARVAASSMFGSTALRVNGKVFAMLVKGALVVKLPKARVDALVETGLGRPFDPGHGRVMKEWVAIKPDGAARWLELAQEARGFAGTGA